MDQVVEEVTVAQTKWAHEKSSIGDFKAILISVQDAVAEQSLLAPRAVGFLFNSLRKGDEELFLQILQILDHVCAGLQFSGPICRSIRT